jgi:hypothetical protein
MKNFGGVLIAKPRERDEQQEGEVINETCGLPLED